MNKLITILSTSMILSTVVLTGCLHDDDDATTPILDARSFDVSVSNITANQPMSPIGVVLHKAGYHAWMDGDAASVALEYLAEGGDNSFLIADADAHALNQATASSAMPIGPGGNTVVQISTTDEGAVTYLSLFSMLVNTNDAFTGVNAVNLGGLAVGDSLSLTLPSWDAGTEENTEALGSLPGPADGGEGFNAARDDFVDLISIHRGVVSVDDGLMTSILDQTHRFDNPVAHVMITRTE